MSSPYVYTPFAQYQPTPYLHPYYNNQQQNSPFIPDATLYPQSPYTASASLPGSPRCPAVGLPSPNHIPEYDTNFIQNWDIPRRERRPSWHGVSGGGGSPMMASHMLQAPYAIGHNRRHSFGNHGSPYHPFVGLPPQGYSPYGGPAPWGAGYPTAPPQFQVHPWLNGESPRGDFIFNVASHAFAPSRLVGPGQTSLLTSEDLLQSAFHPPVTRLKIVCDMIPQWPIVLEYNSYSAAHQGFPNNAPPITLGDVLVAIHKGLNERISHVDWARLSMAEETAVSRAYTRRCKSYPHMEMVERSQGVKKVDFLLDKVWFKGLVRSAESYEVMKLILASG